VGSNTAHPIPELSPENTPFITPLELPPTIFPANPRKSTSPSREKRDTSPKKQERKLTRNAQRSRVTLSLSKGQRRPARMVRQAHHDPTLASSSTLIIFG